MASAISFTPLPTLRARPAREATRRPAAPPPVRASSLRDKAAAGMVAAAATSLVLAGGAAAMEVKLGGDDGSLSFVPQEFSVPAGEKITFKNNAGFPHNVIFDEDEIPVGVNVGEISMQEEDLLNAAGDEFSVVLKEKGTYSFYCAPHQGAGMVGKVTVN